MATHEELVHAFGDDNVATLDRADLEQNGIPELDAEVLATVGLPGYLDVLFTLDTGGDPGAFTILPVQAGEETVRVLTLGRPTDAEDTRYCLDLQGGYVILLTLDDEPRAEVVNRTLDDFVEFLYRYAVHHEDVADLTDEQRRGYTQRLVERLKARDPYAFASAESWWQMVYDRAA